MRNVAGKSTTMRMIMGLDGPDAGQVRISGKSYDDLRWPLREVGALLEAKAFHPGRTARAHLNALAASNAIGRQRVEELLAITGIEKAADRRAGKFSLGMSQPARWKTRSSARSAPPGSAGTTSWGH
jgi:ABC-2 type transport system ATP-binding protein